jgi:hypothetical protein
MSHRQKNRHKSRHRTHPIKLQSLAKYAPSRMLLSIAAPAAAPAPVSETDAAVPARGVEL